jgi:hypothetical protein
MYKKERVSSFYKAPVMHVMKEVFIAHNTQKGLTFVLLRFM